MGLVSPLHNVKGNSVSRPPVTIFVICLLLCATATLAMGFFIQYAVSIPNPEAKGKWLGFLNRLSSIELCVSASEGNGEMDPGSVAQFIDGGGSNSTDEDSVTVSASVHLVSEFKKLPAGMVAAYGGVEVGDWAAIQNTNQPLKSLKMAFVIPHDLTESSNKNSCIILTVPSSFLPLSTRSSVCVPSFLNKSITHVGSLAAINANSTDPICKSGVSLRLNYNRKSEQDFYLSKVEKWNVYQRLIHTSYFLFAVAAALVCFTLLRARTYSSVVTVDKMPLTL